ncbi:MULTISPECIES: hypothetical protein [Paraburkholderia]|uniref:hypothetical protein n=1 Tax=Paraburkholderia TaxID=1822464 RepID=UPI00225AEC2A|nr:MULTISPECIES: hypothetical protein [Paraburkholderia]MCX4161439.1 hypothetical protein [Paraburkholderia megapolitana]MDN7156935.1 hypothetical protein [Paraburkholderia sp. CHISQ3]MDQ6493980.1 hypothetical protein [Paraburkholderia megapolitana]
MKVATCEEALDTAAFIDGLPDGPNRAAHLDVFRHALERNVEQRVKVATREEMLGTAVFIRRLPDIPAKAAHQDEFCRALEQSVSQIGSPATDKDPSVAFLDAASAFTFPDGSLPPKYKARLVSAFADRIGSLSDDHQAVAFDDLCNITQRLNPSELQIEPLHALIKQIKLPGVYGQAQQAIDGVAAIVVGLPEEHHVVMAAMLNIAIESANRPDKSALLAHVATRIPANTLPNTMFAY